MLQADGTCRWEVRVAWRGRRLGSRQLAGDKRGEWTWWMRRHWHLVPLKGIPPVGDRYLLQGS